MPELKFVLAQKEDLDIVMSMFTDAINEMNRKGIYQWDSIYPTRNTLEEDIKKKQLYIGIYEGTVVSTYVLNQEYDEQYVNGDKNDQVYEYKGHSTDDWIISFYKSVEMDSSMLMKEINTTEIPDNLQSDYDWNDK